MDEQSTVRMSQHAGLKMKQMVKSHAGAVNPTSSNALPAVLDPAESKRNYAVAGNMRTKMFMGNVVTRVALPWDVKKGTKPEDAHEDIIKAQEARAKEQLRQIATPWFSSFMPDVGQAGRLNNPGMDAMMRQRQLAPPNTYGQFYAMMHALSAAFGNVQGS